MSEALQILEPDEEAASEAFQDYLEARSLAEATQDFVYAKIAAQAWLKFVNMYAPPHLKMPVGNLIRFPLERRDPPEGFFDE